MLGSLKFSNSSMKWYFYPLLLIVAAVYLFFRLGWSDTIQFGYDQPRLAITMMDYLTRGSYLTSQNFTLETPWGNVSWGPSLTFFFASVLAISRSPLVASQIIAVLNLISVAAVFYIGWRFFSPKVGVVAGLILAAHPWWVIFSRMFYQPSFVPSLVSISMLLTFLVLRSRKSLFTGFLIFSWAVLVQFYLSSLSFITTSIIFLLPDVKKMSLRWVFLGLMLVGVIFTPTFYFFRSNPDKIQAFLSAPGKFQIAPKDIFVSYFKTASGGNLYWELGYGYQSFISENPWIEKIFTLNLLLISLIIGYSFVKAFGKSEDRTFRLFLVLCCIAPLWFLSLVKVEYAVPRYFLISLPALSLLVGLFVEDLSEKIKHFSFVIPMFLVLSWSLITAQYYNFLENYNYPNGFLSHFSDIPYSFLQKSFDFMKTEKPMRGLWAVNYYLDYVDKNPEGKTLYEVSFDAPNKEKGIAARFGPYTIYKIRN